MSCISTWHSVQMMVQPTVHSHLKYFFFWGGGVNSKIDIQFVTLVLPLPEFIFLDKIFNLEQWNQALPKH